MSPEAGVRDVLVTLLHDPPAWLPPHTQRLADIAAHFEHSVADALNAAGRGDSRLPRFVPHDRLPDGEAYEAFIARTGCVPTRDNCHDLFNGLLWLGFPQTKRRLNLLQAEQIAMHGIGGTRGTVRDALTLFDENAVVLLAPAELELLLRQRDWQALFGTRRTLWNSARLVIFGHALLEKLLRPRKAITAHAWIVDGLHDEALASSLTPERLRTGAFMPLPMLGVPGWWSANEDPAFYDDTLVFRPHPPRL